MCFITRARLQEAWNSSRWLNYTFGVLENSSTTWINYPSSIYCSTNQLSDPGFELASVISPGCWGQFGSGVAATVSTSVFATGAQSAALLAFPASRTGGISQTWAIPAGATSSYISFHYAYVGTSQPTLTVTTTTGGAALPVVTLKASTTPTWAFYQASLADYAGTTKTFQISFTTPGERVRGWH